MDQVKTLVKNLTLSNEAHKAPGRLGDPTMDLQSDPRTNPELVKVLQAVQMSGNQDGKYADLDNHAQLEAVCREANAGMGFLYDMPNDLPQDAHGPELEEKEISIDGPDSNKIKLWVYRVKDDNDVKPKPAVCYIHGGGMTIIDTYVKPHITWAKSLAREGTIAIMIDFRNAFQVDGNYHPFPAGLNDCAAAVKYIDAHRSELGISKLIIQGESGGANLSLATALKANREGWTKSIDGVYGCVPYISGAYHWPDERKLKELPSLKEDDGYIISCSAMSAFAKYYSPGEGEMENPLAWPYYATVDDMKGLPPHLLSMDELDPLRDEGIAYFRKLLAAGVKSTAEVNLGITHGSSLIFRSALPEVHLKAVRHIAAFAKSL